MPCAGPLLDLLSPTLRGEAAHHVVGARMRNVDFLHCDDCEAEQRAFTTAIAQHLQLRVYGQGERICSVGEPASELLVIVKVTLNTTIHSSSTVVRRRPPPSPAATFAVAARASSSSSRRIARITTAPPPRRPHLSLIPRVRSRSSSPPTSRRWGACVSPRCAPVLAQGVIAQAETGYVLCNGRYFGEEMLLANGKHMHTCVSVTFATVNTLARGDLSQVTLVSSSSFFPFLLARLPNGRDRDRRRARRRARRKRSPSESPALILLDDGR